MDTTVAALFILMSGHWLGVGTRTDASSHQVSAQIQVDVQSNVTGDLLTSVNQVHELRSTDGGSQPYDYTYSYWLRPQSGGLYEMGRDTSQTQAVDSVGHFDQDHFDLEQNIGGADPFTIQSQTLFGAPGEADYSETVWYHGSVISTSAIHYHRASDSALR